MIKLYTSKYGSINLEEKKLRKVIERLIFDTVSKKHLIKLMLEIKKNSLKKIEIVFKKNCNLPVNEQKNLYQQIEFILSMQFGITDSLVIFSYEN